MYLCLTFYPSSCIHACTFLPLHSTPHTLTLPHSCYTTLDTFILLHGSCSHCTAPAVYPAHPAACCPPRYSYDCTLRHAYTLPATLRTRCPRSRPTLVWLPALRYLTRFTFAFTPFGWDYPGHTFGYVTGRFLLLSMVLSNMDVTVAYHAVAFRFAFTPHRCRLRYTRLHSRWTRFVILPTTRSTLLPQRTHTYGVCTRYPVYFRVFQLTSPTHPPTLTVTAGYPHYTVPGRDEHHPGPVPQDLPHPTAVRTLPPLPERDTFTHHTYAAVPATLRGTLTVPQYIGPDG